MRFAVPASSLASVDTISSAPTSVKRARRVSPVSLVLMSTTAFSIISPVSKPLAMYMVVTPVSVSPFIMAVSIGDAPRYFGKRDA